MKQYFNVSFQYSESVYCANIAHAETVADVEAHYSKYAWASVSPAADYEVEEARRRGKPIIEVDHQPTEEAQEAAEEAQEAAEEAQEAAEEAKEESTLDKVAAELEAHKDSSAWGRGVNAYALELVEELRERAAYEGRNPEPGKECREWMLNGAQDWQRPNDEFAAWSVYSWGGSSLIYDCDIAERLCTPSELKKTRHGERRPNSREEWLDTQARALTQACNRVSRVYRSIVTA